MKKTFCLLWLLIFAAIAFSQSQTPKSNWAKFDNNKVHYYDIGNRKNKDALIFIHGWTCNADFWKESVNAFPEYRVIATDLPGHGQSDKPKVEYSMEYFAKSIEAVMNTAKIESAVLVGHSMGTPVIRQFYRLYPKKTLGLVIVDGALRPMATKTQEEQFTAVLRADYKTNAAKMVDGMLMPIKDENLKTSIRNAMLATPDYVALSALGGMTDDKIWTTDKINVPVLALMAESPFWKPDTRDFYGTIASDLDFQMWKGVSHFLMMDKPSEFNREARLFIARKKLL